MSKIQQIYLKDDYTDGVYTKVQYLVDGNKVDVYLSSTDQFDSTYVESSIYGTFVKIQLFDIAKDTGWVSVSGDTIPKWLDELVPSLIY